MKDDIPQEMKERIHAAIQCANESTKGMCLAELDALTQEAYEMANVEVLTTEELRARINSAVEKASDKLSKMTYEERQEAARKGFERFSTKGMCIAEIDSCFGGTDD